MEPTHILAPEGKGSVSASASMLLVEGEILVHPTLIEQALLLGTQSERPLQLLLGLGRPDEPFPGRLLRDAVDRTDLTPCDTGPVGGDHRLVLGIRSHLPFRHRLPDRIEMIHHTDNYGLSAGVRQEDEPDAHDGSVSATDPSEFDGGSDD